MALYPYPYQVMAPLNCPHTEYWTVLRDPIERIVSRISQVEILFTISLFEIHLFI